ncbi:PAS domain-containing sensor histidine kinase [Xinfangfangia sp. CPCC 101601]|uniref:histidine kinase n=1 Tax=Pseudogemmobacter lacusdianii TaxID=3069608 RepID=A0ABU0VW55_9RHOB|nr:PAS domain-containing sensor histidine kinase [Xinfangfangia sp. CPCC 101601]MDQ2065440.1 PAS domain-containing sensor histidine kinase [Xinfangfangia sp. CPCC 101601]
MTPFNRALRRDTWTRLTRLRRIRRVQTAMTLGLVFLGPVLVVLTFLTLGPLNQSSSSPTLRLILLTDFVYVLVVAALVLSRIARMIADRRSRSAGSRLHLRLTGVFAGMALVPTVLVAVFAMLTVNLGLEGWFSDRVRSVVGTSLAAAQAYEGEQREDLENDAVRLAAFLNLERQKSRALPDDVLRTMLARGQELIQRGLKEAYLIDGTGALQLRGERSYLFGFEPVPLNTLRYAREEGPQLIEDWSNNEFRAVVHLDSFPDRYLYVSREVDGSILSLLDETQETVKVYNQLEADRGSILFNFGLIYLGFALILILAAIWLGLWFAERLARPVGRLAGAAQMVGGGDLNVRVQEEDGDDEIAMLGRLFNQMTHQLKGQREALVENHRQTEQRRRLFDSVLSNVTAGVMGLDPEGNVDFLNRAAMRILDLPEGQDLPLDKAVPEFSLLFERLRDEAVNAVQEEVRLTRRGKLESLLVRMSIRRSEGQRLEGYVVAFDDVTDLVTAQRMAAWGDVARRIAHEIKNPLTPIALSAERLKRKFRGQVQQPEELEQLTDVIVRQTNDLRRIVDEFSKFARMPEPDRKETDLVQILRDAVTLQVAGQPQVQISTELPEMPLLLDLDAGMISQALTNLIKNAGEATESYREKGPAESYQAQIQISLTIEEGDGVIRIMDNGTGLPEDRSRLFEPYVTTREKGTGLGLPIVKKIIEDHGGQLALLDAPVFAGNSHSGAMAEVRLPRLAKRRMGRNIGPQGSGQEGQI